MGINLSFRVNISSCYIKNIINYSFLPKEHASRVSKYSKLFQTTKKTKDIIFDYIILTKICLNVNDILDTKIVM